MSELQTEAAPAEPQIPTEAAPESPDTGAELATASEGQHEEQAHDGDKAQKAINKKHFQFKEQERRADALQARLDAQDKDKQDAQLNAVAPAVPSVPDPYEEDFEDKTRLRDEAIRNRANFDGQQAMLRQAQEQQQQATLQEQQKQIAEVGDKFKLNSTAQGISQEEMGTIATLLNNAGLSSNQGLATHIMANEDGPVIAKYLAANPMELDALLTSSPYSAGAMLDTIKVKANALKPKQSQAPAPAMTLSGRGMPETDERAEWFKRHPGAVIT